MLSLHLFFPGEGITGRHLLKMSDTDLLDMGVKKGSRIDILDLTSKSRAVEKVNLPSRIL